MIIAVTLVVIALSVFSTINASLTVQDELEQIVSHILPAVPQHYPAGCEKKTDTVSLSSESSASSSLLKKEHKTVPSNSTPILLKTYPRTMDTITMLVTTIPAEATSGEYNNIELAVDFYGVEIHTCDVLSHTYQDQHDEIGYLEQLSIDGIFISPGNSQLKTTVAWNKAQDKVNSYELRIICQFDDYENVMRSQVHLKNAKTGEYFTSQSNYFPSENAFSVGFIVQNGNMNMTSNQQNSNNYPQIDKNTIPSSLSSLFPTNNIATSPQKQETNQKISKFQQKRGNNDNNNGIKVNFEENRQTTFKILSTSYSLIPTDHLIFGELFQAYEWKLSPQSECIINVNNIPVAKVQPEIVKDFQLHTGNSLKMTPGVNIPMGSHLNISCNNVSHKVSEERQEFWVVAFSEDDVSKPFTNYSYTRSNVVSHHVDKKVQ